MKRFLLIFVVRGGSLGLLGWGAFLLGLWLGAGGIDVVMHDIVRGAQVVIERGQAPRSPVMAGSEPRT